MKIQYSQNGQWYFTEDEKVTNRVPEGTDLSKVDISEYQTNAEDISKLYTLAEVRFYDVELPKKYVALKQRIQKVTKPRQVGEKLVGETWSGSSSISKQLARPFQDLVVFNDGISEISFSVDNNSLGVMTLKPGEKFDEEIGNFQVVHITANGKYRAYVREVFR